MEKLLRQLNLLTYALYECADCEVIKKHKLRQDIELINKQMRECK